MVRLAATISAIALISAPVIAVSTENYEDTFNRELQQESPFSREAIEQAYGRDIADAIESRDPFFGAIIGAVARIATKVGPKIASKLGRKAGKKAAEHHHNNNNNNKNRRRKRSDYEEDEFEREFEEMDVREFYDDLD